MTNPHGRDKWVVGELPSRASPHRRQAPPPSPRLAERLERANRKNLIGCLLTAALRAKAGKSGGPPPLVLLLLVSGIALLVSALLSRATIVFATAGVAALAATATICWRHRAALRNDSPTQVGYAGELQRDASVGPLPRRSFQALASGHIDRTRANQGDTRQGNRGACRGRPGGNRHSGRRHLLHAGDGRALPAGCLPPLRRSYRGHRRQHRSRRWQYRRRIAVPFLDILHACLERTLARIADDKAQALARHEAFVRTKE